MSACGVTAGTVPSHGGFGYAVPRGLDALADADTIVVPGYAPWHKCTTSVSVEANLGVVEIIRLFIAAMWRIARYRYTREQTDDMPVKAPGN